jgi:hypothetical protein
VVTPREDVPVTPTTTPTNSGDLWGQVWSRLQPDALTTPTATGLWTVLALVLVVVGVPALWLRSRVVVTVVHELGHGLVGMLFGRRFTGLVLRGDMSGHAVTVGPARGAGRVLSTWAGYPAPALVGAFAVHASGAGWAPPALAATGLVLLACLVRVRSLYTAAVMVVLTVVTGLVWWQGGARLQGAVVLGVGASLLVGAWRHLGAVVARPSPGSDPGVLARLTHLPAWTWNAGYVVVLAAASWWAVRSALAMV